MTIIIIGIVVFIIFKVMSKGGARSLVSIIFDHYLSYKKSIKFWEKMGYELEKEFPVMYGHKQDYKTGIKEL